MRAKPIIIKDDPLRRKVRKTHAPATKIVPDKKKASKEKNPYVGNEAIQELIEMDKEE